MKYMSYTQVSQGFYTGFDIYPHQTVGSYAIVLLLDFLPLARHTYPVFPLKTLNMLIR